MSKLDDIMSHIGKEPSVNRLLTVHIEDCSTSMITPTYQDKSYGKEMYVVPRASTLIHRNSSPSSKEDFFKKIESLVR